MHWNLFFTPDDDGGQGGGVPADSGPSAEDIGGGSSGGGGDLAANAAEANAELSSGGQTEGQDIGQGMTKAEAEHFFEIKDEKGKPYRFNSADELRDRFKDFGMLRSDYTRKTQELAREREEFQRQRDSLLTELREQKAQIDKYNSFLKNNPHVMNQLKKAMQQGFTGDAAYQKAQSYADEVKSELQKELEELKNWKERREFSEKQERIYSQMTERHPDFDKQAVQQLLNEVDPNDFGSLVELLHFANLGRRSRYAPRPSQGPASQQKQQARVVPGTGGGQVAPKPASSLDEAYERAMRDAQE